MFGGAIRRERATLSAEGSSVVTKPFKATVVRDGSMCFIPVTFDPRVVSVLIASSLLG